MTEVTFCRAFLSALDARPIKLSGDHIADARNYPAQSAFVLPKLPSPPHPAHPKPKSATTTTTSDFSSSSTSISITLKPMKSTFPTVPLPNITPSQTSIYDLKTAYAAQSSIPLTKIKILYKKKPVTDSKTVAEVIGQDAGTEVEFSVMLMGGAVATPVQSPPAVAPGEAEKGLGAGVDVGGPAAQGPSGKDVAGKEEFWDDLQSFVVQRLRDEEEGKRLVGLFKRAWENDR